MALLIEMYEQQYGVLTADITSKIGKLPSTFGSDKKNLISELDRHLEECNELLEQMELEVREMKAAEQPRLRTRLESYRVELGRLQQEFKRARSASQPDNLSDPADHYSEAVSLNEEQRQRLLDNSERLERSGNQLNSGYQILLETEEISSQVMRDLHHQRETIQKSRARPGGDCPPALPVDVCYPSCAGDDDCEGFYKCCPTACGGSVCSRPVTARRLAMLKNGVCPEVPSGPWVCSDRCSADADCRGRNKCCRNRCGALACVPPQLF